MSLGSFLPWHGGRSAAGAGALYAGGMVPTSIGKLLDSENGKASSPFAVAGRADHRQKLGLFSSGNRTRKACASRSQLVRCPKFHSLSSRIYLRPSTGALADIFCAPGVNRGARRRGPRPQWQDIDFDHQCIHIRRSAWCGTVQSTKSANSVAPITLPSALAEVLRGYKADWKLNRDGFLFATRNGRPPSSNNVVEYQLWPILDALKIDRCGLHAFRHSVASFIVDAGYAPEVAQQQLRHSNARTTLGYIHLRGGITEQAMADVAGSLKLGIVGRGLGKGSHYIQ
jgi:Phage integrase family